MKQMVEVNFSGPSAAIYLFTLLLNRLQIIIHKITSPVYSMIMLPPLLLLKLSVK